MLIFNRTFNGQASSVLNWSKKKERIKIAKLRITFLNLFNFQDEPLSIDCGIGGPSSATPSSLLSTASPLSSFFNENGNDETEFGSTLDVDAIKVRNKTSSVVLVDVIKSKNFICNTHGRYVIYNIT